MIAGHRFLKWTRVLSRAGACILLLSAAGCGTTRMSDTSRTATEQLLISNAIDRSVNEIDFKVLAGKDVYLDTQFLKGTVDENYITSSLRQQMMSHGCRVQAVKDDALYVVEARAGTVGTSRHEVLLGIPQFQIPVVPGFSSAPSTMPEIPFAKTTDQKGVAKIAVFAYNQITGQPVWQSGAFPVSSTAKDTWLLGSGPFQRGSIYESTRFAGDKLILPFHAPDEDEKLARKPKIPVTAEAVYEERPEEVARRPRKAIEKNQNETGNRRAEAEPSKKPAEAPGAVKRASAMAPLPYTTDAETAPAGTIIRLPPLEQAQRPDLVEEVRPRSEESPREPERLSPQEDIEELYRPAGEEAKEEGGSLFRPLKWFSS